MRRGSLAAGVFVFMGTLILGATWVTLSAGDEEIKPSKSKKSLPVASGQAECLVNESAVEDVKKAKEKNEAQAKELSAREADLKVKEKAVSEQIKALEKLRIEISQIQDLKKAENDQRVQQLTDTVLTMNPKSASKMLSSIDENLSVAIMARLETSRLAKILNVMDPVQSARLSERFAGVLKKSNPHPQSSQGTHQGEAFHG